MNQAVVHLVTMKHQVVQSLKYQILAYWGLNGKH
jgi:hypothetical protein